MAADEAEATTEDWDEYSYIVSSRYRRITIDRLQKGPATPSQVAEDTEERMTHISRSLKELRERGVIDLLVSDDRKKGRVYGLNEHGREVAEMVDEYGQ